jgi:hypothetical protein
MAEDEVAGLIPVKLRHPLIHSIGLRLRLGRGDASSSGDEHDSLWVSYCILEHLLLRGATSQLLQQRLLADSCDSFESINAHNKGSPPTSHTSKMLQIANHLF